MERCLRCNEEILPGSGQNGWHLNCIREFFGTQEMPEIELDEKILEEFAQKNLNSGLTVPGVQKKLSLHLHSQGKDKRLTVVGYPAGYILKPQTELYEDLPLLEHVCMLLAKAAGIPVVDQGLLMLNGDYAYITKRADRQMESTRVIKLGMEDFAQLLGRLTEDKYKGSYERIAKGIYKYSSNPLMDLTAFFRLLLFSFVTGNSDMHLKNFSLLETAVETNSYRLSPAYDLLPVKLVLKNDLDELALTLNGKNRNLRRNDFLTFAQAFGLSRKAAENLITQTQSWPELFTPIIENSLLPENTKKDFLLLIRNQVNRLKKPDNSR